MFGAMAAMFIMALTVPEAFHDIPGGLAGPVVLALAYLTVRMLHLAIFWLAADGDSGLRRQLLRFAPSVVGSTAAAPGRVAARGGRCRPGCGWR